MTLIIGSCVALSKTGYCCSVIHIPHPLFSDVTVFADLSNYLYENYINTEEILQENCKKKKKRPKQLELSCRMTQEKMATCMATNSPWATAAPQHFTP